MFSSEWTLTMSPNLCAGILACLDGYMNIAMEQTEEYVNGQLKNKYGDAFIRGNNGTFRGLTCYFTFIIQLSFLAIPLLFYCYQGMTIFGFSFDAVLYISTSKRTLADGA